MTTRPLLVAAISALPLLSALTVPAACFAAGPNASASVAGTQPTKDDLDNARKWLAQAAASAASLNDDAKATACATIAEAQARPATWPAEEDRRYARRPG